MNELLKRLKLNKHKLSAQQYRTIRGQALSGDVSGAERGLNKILWRIK